MTKDVISLSISVLLLFRHYISHKITFGAPSSGGILCSACGAFIITVARQQNMTSSNTCGKIEAVKGVRPGCDTSNSKRCYGNSNIKTRLNSLSSLTCTYLVP